MKLDEKTVEKKYIYKGRIINVRTDTAELPNGKKALREVVEHPGGVTVAALTDNDELMPSDRYIHPDHLHFPSESSCKRRLLHR